MPNGLIDKFGTPLAQLIQIVESVPTEEPVATVHSEAINKTALLSLLQELHSTGTKVLGTMLHEGPVFIFAMNGEWSIRINVDSLLHEPMAKLREQIKKS